MALTKVGKEGITGISNSSDATFLTVTSSEGVTFAGTLAVTGVHTVGNNAIYTSEGTAVTQNLVQGLIKFWLNFDGESTISTRDSFNISGVTDGGEGNYTPAYSNNMSSVNYSMGNNTDYNGTEFPINCKNYATGTHLIQTVDIDLSSYMDHDLVNVHGMGDLA
tara:strand:- start:392 stop:883 length:492 start_codon:yes stop_codon:yes gene_type:complete